MPSSLADFVDGPMPLLRVLGAHEWTGAAVRIIAVAAGPALPELSPALVVVDAAQEWLRLPDAGERISGAAGLVVVGDDTVAAALAGHADVPVAVPATSGADPTSVLVGLYRRTAAAEQARSQRLMTLAHLAASKGLSGSSGVQQLTDWAGSQVDAKVQLVLPGRDLEGWNGDWPELAVLARRSRGPLLPQTARPGHVLVVAAGRQEPRPVLLAERDQAWRPDDTAFISQVAHWAALLAEMDEARGHAVHLAPMGRELRAAGLRLLADGDVAAARRTLRPVAEDLADASAGTVAIVQAGPDEGPAALAAEIHRSARRQVLTVPLAQWRPVADCQSPAARQVIVIQALGATPRLDAVLREIVWAVPGRIAGSSPATPWQRLDAAIDTAAAALDRARSMPGRIELSDGRAPLPELLSADAGSLAARLLHALRQKVPDDAERADLLAVTEEEHWWGVTGAAQRIGRSPKTVRAAATTVADAVGLDRKNIWHAAVLYLMVRLSSPPAPVRFGRQTTLHQALREPRAQEWAGKALEDLPDHVRNAIRAWLLCGRNPARAARAIGVERATVYKYLTAAREATGWNFTKEPGARCELTLALLISDPGVYLEALADSRFRQVAAPDAEDLAGLEDQIVIDTSRPHTARVYDYFLGGSDHFEVDRSAARLIETVNPHTGTACRAVRNWANRAVDWAVKEGGISQIIDIGSGIPSKPNLHQTAQSADRRARVVYIDHDPIVLKGTLHLLESTDEGRVAFVRASFEDGPALYDLARVEHIIDLTRPVALCVNSLTHFIPDNVAYSTVAALVGRLAPGSLQVMTQLTTHYAPALITRVVEAISTGHAAARDKQEFARFFTGLDLVEPGIVCPRAWRPASGTPLPAFATINALAAVGRVRPDAAEPRVHTVVPMSTLSPAPGQAIPSEQPIEL